MSDFSIGEYEETSHASAGFRIIRQCFPADYSFFLAVGVELVETFILLPTLKNQGLATFWEQFQLGSSLIYNTSPELTEFVQIGRAICDTVLRTEDLSDAITFLYAYLKTKEYAHGFAVAFKGLLCSYADNPQMAVQERGSPSRKMAEGYLNKLCEQLNLAALLLEQGMFSFTEGSSTEPKPLLTFLKIETSYSVLYHEDKLNPDSSLQSYPFLATFDSLPEEVQQHLALPEEFERTTRLLLSVFDPEKLDPESRQRFASLFKPIAEDFPQLVGLVEQIKADLVQKTCQHYMLKLYQTVCGKEHCIECLQNQQVCPCGERLSPKNLDDINSSLERGSDSQSSTRDERRTAAYAFPNY